MKHKRVLSQSFSGLPTGFTTFSAVQRRLPGSKTLDHFSGVKEDPLSAQSFFCVCKAKGGKPQLCYNESSADHLEEGEEDEDTSYTFNPGLLYLCKEGDANVIYPKCSYVYLCAYLYSFTLLSLGLLLLHLQ